MGVGFVGLAVGRPARVRDADGARTCFLPAARDSSSLTLPSAREALQAVLVDDRDAGGVVAAVLEPIKAFEQDRTTLRCATAPTMPHMFFLSTLF